MKQCANCKKSKTMLVFPKVVIVQNSKAELETTFKKVFLCLECLPLLFKKEILGDPNEIVTEIENFKEREAGR